MHKLKLQTVLNLLLVASLVAVYSTTSNMGSNALYIIIPITAAILVNGIVLVKKKSHQNAVLN